MEVAIVAGFSAKRDMNIDARHISRNFSILVLIKMAKLTRYQVIMALTMLMSCTFFAKSFAQNAYRLIVRSIDKDSLFITKNLGLPSSFNTAAQCNDYITKLPFTLQQKGYISSSVDSVIQAANQTVIYLFLGEKYNLLSLRIREKDKT